MFHKYHALGNNYLILDPARQSGEMARGLMPALAIAICDRHRGVDSDGIVYGPLLNGPLPNGPLPEETRSGHFVCVIWNPDGSTAEVSGNGMRIFARYLVDVGYVSMEETNACVLHSGGCTIPIAYGRKPDTPIRVELGQASTAPGLETLPPDLLAALGPATLVNVGNPHCVFFPTAPINESLARRWGATVENDSAFPQRTNVKFVQVIDSHTIAIGIWERAIPRPAAAAVARPRLLRSSGAGARRQSQYRCPAAN